MKLEKAQVWVVSEAEGEPFVLLLKTKPERNSEWQPVTGSIEEGETLEEGALRELYEETGFKEHGEILPLGMEFSFNGRYGPAHETVFWLTVSTSLPRPDLDHREHVDFKWVGFADAKILLRHEVHLQALVKLAQRH